MAELIKAVQRPHSCRHELARDLGTTPKDHMWHGSIAQCSCGQRFIMRPKSEADMWSGWVAWAGKEAPVD